MNNSSPFTSQNLHQNPGNHFTFSLASHISNREHNQVIGRCKRFPSHNISKRKTSILVKLVVLDLQVLSYGFRASLPLQAFMLGLGGKAGQRICRRKSIQNTFVSCYMSIHDKQLPKHFVNKNVVTAALQIWYSVELCDWTERATNEFVEAGLPHLLVAWVLQGLNLVSMKRPLVSKTPTVLQETLFA